jgi:hypothetical protein
VIRYGGIDCRYRDTFVSIDMGLLHASSLNANA